MESSTTFKSYHIPITMVDLDVIINTALTFDLQEDVEYSLKESKGSSKSPVAECPHSHATPSYGDTFWALLQKHQINFDLCTYYSKARLLFFSHQFEVRSKNPYS